MTRAIIAARLFDGERWHENHCILLEREQISAVIPCAELPATPPYPVQRCSTIAPGFIDLQVNGGGGVLLNNTPDMASIARMTSGHRRVGTTALMPTLISDTPTVQRAGVAAVAAAIAAGNAGVLGVHLEGPFIDLEKRGTHKAAMLRRMAPEDLSWLGSLTDFPVMLTLAPEHTQPGQIRQLTEAGIRVCAGHTNASYEQTRQAIAEGLRGFSHLFNAMRPATAREPGTVGAALEDSSTWTGIIADGHHVHPANLRLAWRSKAPGKLFLVSDAMATVGSEENGFEIYGERIEVREGRLINAEGALAGSAIGMIDAVRVTHRQAGVPLDECLRMASLYPAEFLGVDGMLGRVCPGHRADLVHFDQQFTVCDTWVAGQHQQH